MELMSPLRSSNHDHILRRANSGVHRLTSMVESCSNENEAPCFCCFASAHMCSSVGVFWWRGRRFPGYFCAAQKTVRSLSVPSRGSPKAGPTPMSKEHSPQRMPGRVVWHWRHGGRPFHRGGSMGILARLLHYPEKCHRS